MPPSHTDWTPGIVILVVGLVFGAVMVWRLYSSRARLRPQADSLELRDLEGKRDSLVRQLRELEEHPGNIGPEELAAERRRLELETAKTLQSIDLLRARPVAGKKKGRREPVTETHAAAAPLPDTSSRTTAGVVGGSSATKGFLWGVGIMSAVGLLIFFVSRVATERVGDAQLTGNLPEAVQPRPDQELTALLTTVERNPDDVNARLELAFAYLVRENLMEVFNHTEYVLQRVPGEPRALSYQALVRLAMGQGEMAETMLKQALATEPNLLDARIHLALVYTQLGRADEATEVMREAIRRHPEESETLTTLLAQIRASMTDPERPVAAMEQQTPAGPQVGGSIAGTLELSPASGASIVPGAVVFITVRSAGVTGGPPVAAKRLPVTGFPMSFTLSPADSMMGQELPQRLRIEARIDTDGDAATRGENEPAAFLDDVPLGGAAVRLLLR